PPTAGRSSRGANTQCDPTRCRRKRRPPWKRRRPSGSRAPMKRRTGKPSRHRSSTSPCASSVTHSCARWVLFGFPWLSTSVNPRTRSWPQTPRFGTLHAHRTLSDRFARALWSRRVLGRHGADTARPPSCAQLVHLSAPGAGTPDQKPAPFPMATNTRTLRRDLENYLCAHRSTVFRWSVRAVLFSAGLAASFVARAVMITGLIVAFRKTRATIRRQLAE